MRTYLGKYIKTKKGKKLKREYSLFKQDDDLILVSDDDTQFFKTFRQVSEYIKSREEIIYNNLIGK